MALPVTLRPAPAEHAARRALARRELSAVVLQFKRAKADWSSFNNLNELHLDILAWIGGCLHQRAQSGAPPFTQLRDRLQYLVQQKTLQLGRIPSSRTGDILAHYNRMLWARELELPEIAA